MSQILKALRDRVLLCDGAFGSRIQAMDLDVERDYQGAENCTEILNVSRPKIVQQIHEGYLEAGSDIVQTNSFGGSPLTLAEFGIADEAFALNYLAGELARVAVRKFAGDGRQRFVLGSVGPGTRLPSLGHTAYGTLEDAFFTQCSGLVVGGVDALLIETCQDPLQIKAAVNGARRAFADVGRVVPIFVQVTVETTGTLLVGADIAAAATVVHSLGVDAMGLNCATGPHEMAEHVRWLGANWPGLITVQPNAGLPELHDGHTHYPLTPGELAEWADRFVAEDGVNVVGGCCGSTPEHIAAVDAMLRTRAHDGYRPRPAARDPRWIPAVASLYSAVPLRQENAILSIGERCNANGSRQFRELQAAEDWDGCIEIGRSQLREGSHALDVCTAYVGRDEVADMTEMVSRLRGAVDAPLVIDSTELPVLEAALRLVGGKPVINSINFENGNEAAEARLELARKHGAAVIALTIDEDGMAKTADDKLRIAERLYDMAVNKYSLPPSDLLFDPLTFTVCTGMEDDRKLAIETLDGIERIAERFPDCQVILGLSNISFGLKAAARHVLNSVFLDEAVKHGMTGAIIHVSKIKPLHAIPEDEAKVALDLIYDRRAEGYDPLQAFLALFEGREATVEKKDTGPVSLEEKLHRRIVDGDRNGLADDLDDAMKTHPPLDIVNEILLGGMKEVGELFGSGQMQLPFVLQSAETMKAAVAHLEPHMEKVDGQRKGTVVLATVKGDVHDIGKNLVDIILTNNGYNVVNLGIKQPIANILDAASEHKADAIGMSGLLVKSTVVMRENLEEMTREAIDVPVMLGGAALTRAYVEEDCVAAYGSARVAYARDAFDGLKIMARVVNGDFDDYTAAVQAKRASRPSSNRKSVGRAANAAVGEVDAAAVRARRDALNEGVVIPEPPFWGPRVIARVPVKALLPYLNERMLFQFHWGFRKDGRKLDEYMEWAKKTLRPVLKRMTDTVIQQDILLPQASYGYWKAAGDGDRLVLFEENGIDEAARFALPRQAGADGKCITDYVPDIAAGPEARGVVGLQVVTMGQRAADVAREWFADDRYQDYVYLHGLGVEMAEAMAEYVHKRVRSELGYASEEARDMDGLLKQEYRGSRYSFGYPACPRLEDQDRLLALLGADEIGVELSEEHQLHPEMSTSALVIPHKLAKYFSV
ncbi:MAG: methionine synthase [Alphaproteobacteria bacterium]|nr:methionine synthase [Alphaproteobacteria bacterium]